jgi:hypothetical protein
MIICYLVRGTTHLRRWRYMCMEKYGKEHLLKEIEETLR